VVEPSRKRGPFDPRWPRARSLRHLHLVREPAKTAGEATIAGEARETTTDRGLALVTHVPTFTPTEEEHDGHEGENRGASAPEHDRGARPRTNGEPEAEEGEEDLAWEVAVVLPVPGL
jgi:hypothetical protein